MAKRDSIITAMIVEENEGISFVEVCRRYHLDETYLKEMVEHGAFTITIQSKKEPIFTHDMLDKVNAICRLQKDLGVNIPGALLALDLFEKLDSLQTELEILRKYFK